jgi:putative ABC transport system ATP-binding protein
MQTKSISPATLPSQKAPILEARGIVKVLGQPGTENTVLKGVDVTLYPGELTLLMGPSGSGKTTLLSILGCILTATKGEISIGGERAHGLGPEALADIRRRHVGFVFQSYNLFPTLTALENVMLALDVRNGAERGAVERATEALVSVGLGHRLDAYPSKLSGGEKQRVALARALSGRGSIILADEPTAALDSENGRAVMELLAKVAKDPSRAVLAVTHDHRTLAFADRIIHIEDGLIVGEERPRATAAPAPTPGRAKPQAAMRATPDQPATASSPEPRGEPRLIEQNENHPDRVVAEGGDGSKSRVRRRRRA